MPKVSGPATGYSRFGKSLLRDTFRYSLREGLRTLRRDLLRSAMRDACGSALFSHVAASAHEPAATYRSEPAGFGLESRGHSGRVKLRVRWKLGRE